MIEILKIANRQPIGVDIMRLVDGALDGDGTPGTAYVAGARLGDRLLDEVQQFRVRVDAQVGGPVDVDEGAVDGRLRLVHYLHVLR